jgi:hypothetical protein
MRPDLERKFISRYVIKAKRNRYLGFIEREKTRGLFLGMLYHGQDFDKQLFQELKGNHQKQLEAILAKTQPFKKNDSCYVISVDSKWDGQEIPLAKAIEEIVGREGSLILFAEGAVIYYEGEGPHNCYLSL